MKKVLFLASLAAMAMASCTSESNEYVGNGPEQKEIAFMPLAQRPTRAPVDGTTFTPTTMTVTAYNATASANYFGATAFSGSGDSYTGGKYWPFTSATINFLAIAEANSDNTTGVTWGPTISGVASNPTEKVQIVMSDNSSAQRDLMYACGTGTVTQTSNALAFPGSVGMIFKHAQAWVKFNVQAGNANSASSITINHIQLNSVSCQGTYLVTHTNWDKTKAQRDQDASNNGSVAGVWSNYSTYASNINAAKDENYNALSTSSQLYGSLMVVPDQGMASFTINYTLGGNTYNYTYTPASPTLAQATKYTYNITLTLNEIVIDPDVTDWSAGSGGDVPVQ